MAIPNYFRDDRDTVLNTKRISHTIGVHLSGVEVFIQRQLQFATFVLTRDSNTPFSHVYVSYAAIVGNLPVSFFADFLVIRTREHFPSTVGRP